MNNITLLVFGLFLSLIGILNITGDISTVHSYNRRKVRKEDVPKYGRAMGTGTLIIGVSLVAAFVVAIWNEAVIMFIIIPAVLVGISFMLYAQFRYNRGIF